MGRSFSLFRGIFERRGVLTLGGVGSLVGRFMIILFGEMFEEERIRKGTSREKLDKVRRGVRG